MKNDYRVAIIGGSGMLGCWLKSYFQQHSFVKAFSVGRSPENDVIVNVYDQNLLEKTLKNLDLDYIVNTAALASVDYCEKNVSEAYLANAELPRMLGKFSHVNNVQLIHISTDHFYDHAFSYENQILPKNVYALTKLLGEKNLSEKKDLILRTNFFGKSMTPKKSFSDWVYQQFSENNETVLFDDVYISFIHWSTLAEFLILSFQNFIPGIYNFGTKDKISKADFAIRLKDLLQLSGDNYKVISSKKLSLSATQIVRPFDMSMNTDKLEQVFKFSLPTMEQEFLKLKKEYI